VNFPIKASIIIWGIIMFSTAVIGFNGLKYLNIIAVPLMIAVSVIGLYMALSGSGMETIKAYLPTGDKLSMIDGINIVIGGFIVGAVLPADYTRYQKKRVDVLKSSFVGIFPIGLGLLVAGALFGIAAGTEDLTSIFIGLGIPVLGLVSLILTTWPANGANVYSAGLDAMKVLNLDDKYRAKVTVACGLIGTIVGSFEIIFYFETFLIYLGMIIAPFAGVMIADYWIIGKGKPENWIPRDGIHWIGMIALALGIVTSIFIPWAIPSVNGIVISMLSYLLLSKLTTNKAQQK
jgi:cytosine permease